MRHLDSYEIFESSVERLQFVSLLKFNPQGGFSFYAAGVVPVFISETIKLSTEEDYSVEVTIYEYTPQLKNMEFKIDYRLEDYETKPVKLTSSEERDFFGYTGSFIDPEEVNEPEWTYMADFKQGKIRNIDRENDRQKPGFVFPLKPLEEKFMVLENGDRGIPDSSFNLPIPFKIIDSPYIFSYLPKLGITLNFSNSLTWVRVK